MPEQNLPVVIQSHLPLLIVMVVACLLAGAILFLGSFLGPKRSTPVKDAIFECGNVATGDARQRFNVKFYMVAILFLVFDIEAVFIYPWAVVFADSIKRRGTIPAGFALAEMGVFIVIVLVGLAYAWRKGALEWNSNG